jgi:hypothetical protein
MCQSGWLLRLSDGSGAWGYGSGAWGWLWNLGTALQLASTYSYINVLQTFYPSKTSQQQEKYNSLGYAVNHSVIASGAASALHSCFTTAINIY